MMLALEERLDSWLAIVGCRLLREHGWLELRAPCDAAHVQPSGLQPLGQPGLWRVVEDPARGRARVFEWPWRGAAIRSADEAERTPLSLMQDWAMVTFEGRLARSWQPPARAGLDAWLPSPRLVVRAGAVAAQGALLAADGVLRLSLPLATRPFGSLPPARRAWAAACLRDTQCRLRLVRLGVRADDDTLAAEVDLSGAPAELVAGLLPVAAAALRAAGESLLPTLSLLFNAGSAVALLEQPPLAGAARGKDRR